MQSIVQSKSTGKSRDLYLFCCELFGLISELFSGFCELLLICREPLRTPILKRYFVTRDFPTAASSIFVGCHFLREV